MRISSSLRPLLGGVLLALAAAQSPLQAQTAYITHGAGLPVIRGGDLSIYKPIESASLSSLGAPRSALRPDSAASRQILPASSAPQLMGDVGGPWGASSNQFSVQLSQAVFQDVNAERRKRGLRPVSPDHALAKAAGAHAVDMISGDFFGHYTPDSRNLEKRLRENSVPAYDEVAENLWEAQGRINWNVADNRQRAIQDWLNSDKGHREALLDANLHTAGVGVAIRDGRIAVALLLARP